MRKINLIVTAFMLVFAMNVWANPQELVIGNNSYTVPDFSANATVEYNYTNASGSDELLVLTSNSASISFSMTIDGNLAVQSVQNDRKCFEVPSGKSAVLKVTTYKSDYAFNVDCRNVDLSAGGSEATALEIPETIKDFYVKSYNGNPTYMKYVAKKDGLLQLEFNHALMMSPSYYKKGESATTFSYMNDQDSEKYYVGKFYVQAGNTYYISFLNSTPQFLDAEVVSVSQGTSADGPFVGVIGENVLPAKAGHYWYSFNSREQIKGKYLVLNSEANLNGGSVKVFTSVTDASPFYKVDDVLAARIETSLAISTYLVRIEKTADTDADEVFTAELGDGINADFKSSSDVLEVGKTYKTPHYNGLYYYTVTIPEDVNNKFLVVDGTVGGPKKSKVGIGLESNYEYYLASSNNGYVRCPVEGGKTYVITWYCSEGINDFDFALSYEDIKEGEIESSPIRATEYEEYDIPANESRYYLYIPTGECWLNVATSEAAANVAVKKYGSSLPLDATKTGNITKVKADASSYLIRVDGTSDDITCMIFEEPLASGENCASAIEVTGDEVSLPAEPLDKWYKYTATKSGVLVVSSDIVYESNPKNPTMGSDIKVKLGDCDAIAQSIMGFDSSYNLIYSKNFTVNEGDVLYVNVKTFSAQENKSLKFAIRDFNEGEAPSTAIEIGLGELTLPQTNSLTSPVWYYINLNAGEFDINPGTATTFSFAMYSESDLNNPVASTTSSGSIFDGDVKYFLQYVVPTAGKYFLKLSNSAEGTTVVLSSTSGVAGLMADGTKVVGCAGGVVVAPVSVVEVNIYDIEGRLVASKTVADSTKFNLSTGVYVVNAGGKSVKVMVK